MKSIVVSSLMALLVCGCATPYPSAPVDANYGDPPEDYQALIVNYMSERVDPSKVAQYRFVEPQRAFVIQNTRAGAPAFWAGYGVDFFIELKDEGDQAAPTVKYVALLRQDLETNRVALVEPKGQARFLVHYTPDSMD